MAFVPVQGWRDLTSERLFTTDDAQQNKDDGYDQKDVDESVDGV
jgi:hypothetical protein